MGGALGLARFPAGLASHATLSARRRTPGRWRRLWSSAIAAGVLTLLTGSVTSGGAGQVDDRAWTEPTLQPGAAGSTLQRPVRPRPAEVGADGSAGGAGDGVILGRSSTRSGSSAHIPGAGVGSGSPKVSGIGPESLRRAVQARVDRWAPPIAARWGPLPLPASIRLVPHLAGPAGWAAVTHHGSPPEVLISASSWRELSDEGKDVVVAHELAHAAARAWAPGAVPGWLDEGLAEWTALRVIRGGGPQQHRDDGQAIDWVPTPTDFRSAAAGAAYSRSEGMVEVLARCLGDQAVHQVYRQVAAAGPEGLGRVLSSRGVGAPETLSQASASRQPLVSRACAAAVTP